MARLLIGSSNVYRFYEAGKFTSYNPYIMVNCTKVEVFKAKMDALEAEDKENTAQRPDVDLAIRDDHF